VVRKPPETALTEALIEDAHVRRFQQAVTDAREQHDRDHVQRKKREQHLHDIETENHVGAWLPAFAPAHQQQPDRGECEHHPGLSREPQTQ
jgi:hypothetical protein